MIRGDMVDLKPFDLNDLDFLLRWNNDPDYVGEFEPLEPVTEEDLREWLPKPKSGRSWFIIQTKRGEKVGQIVSTEKDGKTVQVGYRVAPPHRNKGYCTDAVRTLSCHLFTETEVEVLMAEANPRNTASWRVLEKAEFVRTGYRERAVKLVGRWLDGYVYELKKSDYSCP